MTRPLRLRPATPLARTLTFVAFPDPQKLLALACEFAAAAGPGNASPPDLPIPAGAPSTLEAWSTGWRELAPASLALAPSLELSSRNRSLNENTAPRCGSRSLRLSRSPSPRGRALRGSHTLLVSTPALASTVRAPRIAACVPNRRGLQPRDTLFFLQLLPRRGRLTFHGC